MQGGRGCLCPVGCCTCCVLQLGRGGGGWTLQLPLVSESIFAERPCQIHWHGVLIQYLNDYAPLVVQIFEQPCRG
jgi:hypothetical protein